MAIIFIGPKDTRGSYVSPADVENWWLQVQPVITKEKATELETLWRLATPENPEHSPYRLVTNRYEASHDIMYTAYRKQQEGS